MIPDLNQDILAEINDYFGKIREEAMAERPVKSEGTWRKYQYFTLSGSGRQCFQT